MIGNYLGAIRNWVAIYMAVTGRTAAEVETRFEGKGYAEFKRELADALVARLEPIQTRYRAIREDRSGLTAILKEGAHRARAKAEPVLSRVHRAVGFLPGPADGADREGGG
jgi:tryptophanyl-tRNA synthetase